MKQTGGEPSKEGSSEKHAEKKDLPKRGKVEKKLVEKRKKKTRKERRRGGGNPGGVVGE